MKIILIDDNDSNNYYHKLMMEKAGLDLNNVIVFTNPQNALEDIKSNVSQNLRIADFILLDINMPGMTGWEFINKYKELKIRGPQPVIYLVSNSRHPDDIKKAEKEILVSGILEKHLDEDFFRNLKL